MKIKIRKQIFTSGNSFVIYLDKTIMDGFDLKEGDIIDISDMFKVLENVKPLPKNQGQKEIKEKLK